MVFFQTLQFLLQHNFWQRLLNTIALEISF